MKTVFKLLMIGITMLSLMGCGMLNSLFSTTSGAGTVSNLWSDVPPLQGASKTDLEMPLAFRLMIQAVSRGGIDYIAYTTSQTPDEVRNFYSAERMKADGWQTADLEGNQGSQQSCIGDQQGAGSSGELCLFAKQDSNKEILLAIVVAEDTQSKRADVFYARINASNFETPAPGKSTQSGS
jgi:hypothetical protein